MEKKQSALKRMRWKATLFINQNRKLDNVKTWYCFKSRLHPQLHPDFEKELFDIVRSIKFIKR